MNLKFVVASVVLLLLCSEAFGRRLQKREAEDEDKELFAQIQEAAKEYYDSFTSTTQGWIEKIKTLDVSQKIKDSYDKLTKTVGTYLDISYDQVYHWWQNN